MSKRVLFKFLVAIIFSPIFYFVILPSSVFAETCSLSGAATVTPGSSVNIDAAGFSATAMNHSFHIRFVDLSARPPIDAAGSFIPSSSPPPFTVQAPSLAGVYEIELIDDTSFRTFSCTTSLSGNVINVQASDGGGGGGGGVPPAGRSCTATPSTGLKTGDTITVSGSGFPPSTTGVYGYHFEPASLSNFVNTDASGAFSHSAIVWKAGTFNVVTARGINPSNPEQLLCNSITVGPGATPPSGRGPLISGANPCSGSSCDTALGGLSSNPADFTSRLVAIAVGIAGGIALIIMVRGAIKILMASGDPQKIADGRDLIVAAVAGLLFLIFSVLILRFLGSDLLGIT